MFQAWTQTGIKPNVVSDRLIKISAPATAITRAVEGSEGSVGGAWTGSLAGGVANTWSGASVYDATVTDYLGQAWNSPQVVREVWIRMYRWSRDLRFRVGDSMDTLRTIRVVSLQTPFDDDYGVPFSSSMPLPSTLGRLPSGYNKFIIPAYAAARFFVIDGPTYLSSIAGDQAGGTPNSRLGMHQAQLWSREQ